MLNKLDVEELKKIGKYNNRTLNKIENGYPIQYIIGNVNFYGYKINVNKNVLIPRFETETLVEKTIKYIKKYYEKNVKILDLCCGSGCIGIALKKEIPYSSVTMSDISIRAIRVAKENVKQNNADIDVYKSNLFNNINGKFDVIISNPPYIPNDEKLPRNVLKEPHKALFGGKKGTELIEKIFNQIKPHLSEKYIIALEIHENSKDELTKLINIYFKNINYYFEEDLSNRLRYLFIINE